MRNFYKFQYFHYQRKLLEFQVLAPPTFREKLKCYGNSTQQVGLQISVDVQFDNFLEVNNAIQNTNRNQEDSEYTG
jgi:hypothetical protein